MQNRVYIHYELNYKHAQSFSINYLLNNLVIMWLL